MMKIVLFFMYLSTFSCNQSNQNRVLSAVLNKAESKSDFINTNAKTLKDRFSPPEGFSRKAVSENSFTHYLRNIPFKPAGSKVKYYDGKIKFENVHEAVIDMEISGQNLQQCADAVIRLKAEYLYNIGAYDKISFSLTNGFIMDYDKWKAGNRLSVNGNITSWIKTHAFSNSYKDFRKYLEIVFTYAGTLSLNKSLKSKKLKDLEPGDVFIIGGSPGHAVTVMDVVENNKGEKLFMLAQSYMPAQETHILKNFNNPELSPWYKADFEGSLYTPQWKFEKENLKSW